MAKHVNLHSSNALMRAYNQSKTIPPRITRSAEDDYPDTALIPGFGGVRKARENQRATRNAQAHMGHHDGAPSPAGTGPFRKKRGGRTRPTPGAVRRPRLN